jgi:ABC-2 type transport system permease protein
MSGVRQGWLVARREMRERSRSKGLWAGTAFMLLVVVAAIVVPALADNDKVTRDVGFTGVLPDELPAAVTEQGEAVDVTVRVHRYDDTSTGEEAVRDEDIGVLVVDARRLQWRGDADERLRAVVTGAIQLVAVQERAAAAGITPDQLAALAAPVPVENEELGIAAGRSPDDETAAYAMSILLLLAMATYGQLVLTGVVQEKSSRVVEVLLARMPAHTLLAGKVTGIGLLGFTQFAVTALAALIATAVVDAVDLTAISGDVLAWVVAWFLLGYAIYAMAYGAFGSLASRTEDASSIAAPVSALLLVGYWASLIAVSSDPEGRWAQLVSLFPATAAFAMPGRIALGAAAWWEPVLAAALTLAAIVGLVAFAGRVYTGAILRTGATVKLRDAWRRTKTPGHRLPESDTPLIDATPQASPTNAEGRDREMTQRDTTTDRTAIVVPLLSLIIGVAAAVLASDVIIGVAVGAAFYAVVTRIAKARAGHDDHPYSHR